MKLIDKKYGFSLGKFEKNIDIINNVIIKIISYERRGMDMFNLRKNLRKMCLGLAFISVLSLSSIEIKASELDQLNGWVKQNESWYNYKDGFKQTGWMNDKSKWYFLYSNGKMATLWTKINGDWYYFYTDGSMACDTTIDGKYIDENSIWK